MAKDEVSQSDGASIIEKSVGLVERAWDAQWSLRLLFVVLFFDGAMLLRTGRGLWQWSEAGPGLFNDVGWLASIVVAFCVTAAIVMPTVLTLLTLSINSVIYALPSVLWLGDQQSIQPSIGQVPASTVRDEALNQKDDFLLRLYENHERERREGEKSRRRIGSLLATALLAVLVDGWIGHRAVDGLSLVGVLIEALGSWSPGVITIVLVPVVLCLKWAWFPPYTPNYIYYPPLVGKRRM